MGQALYRQYRPKSLEEVVGQEHITGTLLNALKSGKLAHAYLFTGPRGVGKTSIARILAHEINGLPYTDDSMHLDIIEIDAASNRRIDEIRELRDKVSVAPSLAKYKVYIIDEVHMLTREAFNALLKTLEEPPAHVVFILATTETHKLPETIISRTQRFMFKPYDQTQVASHLRYIADHEGLKINDEALALIAAYGEGSFRDSISLLDQTRGLQADGKDGTIIDADAVRGLTGVPTDEAIAAIDDALAQADAAVVARTLGVLRDQGFAAPQIAKRLSQRIRQRVLDANAAAGSLALLEKLLEVPAAHDPESYLELTLLSYALAGTPATVPVAPPIQYTTSPITEVPISRPAVAPVGGSAPPAALATPTVSVTKPAEQIAAPATKHGQPSAEVDATIWPAVVASLKKTHNTLYGIIRMATPIFYEGAIELHFTFAFHKKRLSEPKNQEIVIGVIKTITGRELALHCVLDSKDAPKPTQAAANLPPPDTKLPGSENGHSSVTAINNIFGGAEVL